jgi:glycolate oxidase iron-sulfur subunit
MTAQAAVSKAFPGARIPSAVSRWLSGSNGEVDLPTPQPAWQPPALDESALPPVRGEVYLLQGCAMDVLFPRVHVATRRLLRRIGFIVRDVPKACCGAMHAHNGELEEARDRARHLIHTMPNDLPVIVNSAGCGSTMKEFSKLLGTEAEGYASRTFDLSEFLVKHGLQAQLAQSPGLSEKITYHDACHLAHGQRITSPPRELLHAIPHAEVIPLPEADTCCGSAGIYNVLQPAMARRLLDRKMSHIQATGARIVVLGNPGCHAWMAQGAAEQGRIAEQGGIDERGGISVLHTAEILEASFIGLTSLFNSVG